MKRIKIKPTELNLKPHQIWLNQWFLLTSGDFQKNEYNTMTVAWGSIGTMWNKPFAQIVVRPTRYTYEFTEKYDSFTLCSFPEKYRKALNLLGTKSGRDGDKIQESGLTIIESEMVKAPCFGEAELIIECVKIYWDDFKPDQFLKQEIHKTYPLQDYHRIYFGEIVSISGTEDYKSVPYI
jgi:flavin reductase (DIM6/NTAB) family NADH-FMN oxidoreductase RutF